MSTPTVIRIEPIEMPLPVHSSNESLPPKSSPGIVWALLYKSPSDWNT